MPSPLSADDPILTTRAAADLLGMAVSTVQKWLENGAIPSWKTPGGHRRIRLSTVHSMLRERALDASGVAEAGDGPLSMPSLAYPLPPDEAARLRALESSGLIDGANDPAFDRLTWLASEITGSPLALLTLLAAERQWFKAHTGFKLTETPRAWAFCNHAIVQDEPLVIEDALADPRFRDNPLVTQDPHLRFYAGCSVVDSAGHRLGTLCVMDYEPRRLRSRELRALRELSAIASAEIQRRR